MKPYSIFVLKVEDDAWSAQREPLLNCDCDGDPRQVSSAIILKAPPP